MHVFSRSTMLLLINNISLPQAFSKYFSLSVNTYLGIVADGHIAGLFHAV